MSRKMTENTQKLVQLALLSAIIAVLTVVCTFIKIGPISITLALAPIIIGAALYGWRAGALLGLVFGAVVYITGLLGWDGGFIMVMMGHNALFTTLVCILKGMFAGLAAGLIYQPISKKHPLAAVITAGIVTPVVNTGLFALAAMTIFYDLLAASAQGTGYSPLGLLFLAWIGINFIVELVVNLILGTTITRIIAYAHRRHTV